MINTSVLTRQFEEMGARVSFTERDVEEQAFYSRQRGMRRMSDRNIPTTVDIKRGKFQIDVGPDSSIYVVDLDEAGRHLLLSVIQKNGHIKDHSKFLCGHDERNWFVAGVPATFRTANGRPKAVTTVNEAKQALKPKELIEVETKAKAKGKTLHCRHRRLDGFGRLHRQGEFFFVPAPEFSPKVGGIDATLKRERLSRGGNPHVATELVRRGGRPVHVLFGKVYEEADFKRLQKLEPEKAKLARSEQVDPTVYVRGKITHPEHATVDLGRAWHRVMISNETRKNVLFVD
jgi:hypothetical protein